MLLDSVRELKSEWSQLLLTTAARPRIAHAMAFEARRMTDLRSAPTLALGVAPGANGKDFRLAVRLQRRSASEALHLEDLTTRSRGEIDVRYVGRIHKRTWFTDRHRPIQMGISIGHFRITAGTLGAFVTGPKDTVRILSNNHVLADENQGVKGDAILQPGAIDGGVDAKVGVLRGTRAKVAGVAAEDAPVDLVEKWGRTTGHTRGRVTAFELDNVVVGYEMGNLRFDGQVEIEAAGSKPFSEGGDSGSLIMTAGEHLGVVLLFAGSQTGGRRNLGLTYANPIAPVLQALNIDLLA